MAQSWTDPKGNDNSCRPGDPGSGGSPGYGGGPGNSVSGNGGDGVYEMLKKAVRLTRKNGIHDTNQNKKSKSSSMRTGS